MSEPLGPSQNHRQIDQQSGAPRWDEKVLELIDVNEYFTPIDKRSVTGIKMSAHDILATLSGNRIEITKIEFTSRTSEGRGGHADVILATLVLDSFEPLKSGRQKVAIKKFRLSIEMDEEKFLRAFVNEIPMKGSGADGIRSAALLLEIGDLHRLQDENDQAFLSFEDALTIARSTGDISWRWQTPRSALEQSIGNEGGRADAFLQLGDIHRAQSNLAEAEAFYEEALAIFTSSQRDGESYHTQSLALYTALGNGLGRANALVALGDDHLAQASYAGAEASYAQALVAYTSIGYDLGRGDSLLALADIHRRQRDYAKAEELYTQALDFCTSIGYNLGRANTLLGLGNNCRARSDHVGAKDSFRKALDMFTKMDSSKGRVSALVGLAQIHLDQAKYAEGKAFIDQASEISNKIGYDGGKRHLKQMLGKYLRGAPSSAVPLPTPLPSGEIE
ncbi:hypothetical protein M407DRAFT_31872 [Tulasnella calospora MUT 4182]|uniref:MalT-like TPR region domain-containing protein n=1 Tax=Tulasnella calospora MUT 4182 TaxID=1051891 RepID=A0A0C3LAI9_9AGAM|nr:hypothetical protein M407DRAFT_31872 [Tulasnella calospora MUT 4182]